MNSIKTAQPIVGYWDTRQGGRPENQDSCGFFDTPRGHLAIVCDGMGGGPAGKLASSLAVQHIIAYVSNAPEDEKSADMLRNAIEHAHQAILDEAAKRPELKGMGTTATVLLIGKDSATVAHVGDSRIYQFRNGNKIFRTEDHSWVAEMVRNKSLTEEQARLSSQSNIITRALGGKSEKLADVQELSYEAGDRFMLCTDGIWGMLSEKELIHKAAKTPSLAGAVDSLVLQIDEFGRQSGNTHDNLTLAIIETKNNSTKKGKMRKKDRLLIRVLLLVCAVLLITTLRYCSKASKIKSSENELIEVNNAKKNVEHERDSLKNVVYNLQNQLAELREDVAKMKTKEAEKAIKDAEKSRQDAEKTREQLPQSSTEGLSEAIKELVDQVVRSLGDVKKIGSDARRSSKLKDINQQLRNLIVKDQSHKDDYQKVITSLNASKNKPKEINSCIDNSIVILNNIKKK